MKILPFADHPHLDFHAVIEIYAANGWGTAADYRAEEVRAWFEQSSCALLVLDDDSRLVGIARVMSDSLNTWLCEIVVHPARQRGGVGSLLMHDIIARYGHTALWGEAIKGTEGFFSKFGIVPRSSITAVSRAPSSARRAQSA